MHFSFQTLIRDQNPGKESNFGIFKKQILELHYHCLDTFFNFELHICCLHLLLVGPQGNTEIRAFAWFFFFLNSKKHSDERITLRKKPEGSLLNNSLSIHKSINKLLLWHCLSCVSSRLKPNLVIEVFYSADSALFSLVAYYDLLNRIVSYFRSWPFYAVRPAYILCVF